MPDRSGQASCSIWAALFGVAVTIVVARQTAAIDCAGVDGCIPAVELLLGITAGVGAGIWTGGSCRRRGAGATIALASAALGVWWAIMRLAGSSICPSEPEAGVCSNGFLLGGALIALLAVAALLDRRSQRQRR